MRFSQLVISLAFVLGCSGLLGTPCDTMLTAADLEPLVPGQKLNYRAGYSSSKTCVIDYNPEGTFQTWGQVEANLNSQYGVEKARLDENHRNRSWLDLRTIEGDGWTAELGEAANDQAALDAAAARMGKNLEEAVAAAAAGGKSTGFDMGAQLGGLPPEQHVWMVVGPTWRATFMLDKDVISGADLDDFVKRTANRVP